MKKLLLVLVIAVASLSANDTMRESMHKMEMGLDKIQKGYLYNNKTLISEGLDEVYEGNKLFKKVDMAKYLPQNKQHMLKRALGHSESIDKSQAAMKNAVLQSKYYDAIEYQGEIVKACAACHGVVRSW